MAEEHCKISAAIVAETEEKSCVLKIDGYSRTKGLFKSGEYASSPRFSVGDHNWAVNYYPNGNGAPGFVSVYLVLDSVDAKNVRAKLRFSVLDKDGLPVPSYSRACSEHIFPSKGSDWGFAKFIEKENLEGSVHLRDDVFTIGCDVTVLKGVEEKTKGKFVVVPPSDLHRHLGDLLKSKDEGDVTFQVGGEMFSAHRSVLAARSSVFKAELFGAMKEKAGSPIKISDMESEVFKSLLHFMYTDSLPEMNSEGDNEGEARGDVVVTHGDVVMAGHLLVSADRLCSHVDTEMVVNSLALAEQHSCHGLNEACFEFLASPSNLEVMIASDGYEHLKKSCPSVLKELVARLLPAELKAAKDVWLHVVCVRIEQNMLPNNV